MSSMYCNLITKEKLEKHIWSGQKLYSSVLFLAVRGSSFKQIPHYFDEKSWIAVFFHYLVKREKNNMRVELSRQNFSVECNFSKFYGKVGVIFWSISFVKITLNSKILTWKVELWLFSLNSLVKKHLKTTFLRK